MLYQALTLYETEDKLVGLPEGRPIWSSEQEVLPVARLNTDWQYALAFRLI